MFKCSRPTSQAVMTHDMSTMRPNPHETPVSVHLCEYYLEVTIHTVTVSICRTEDR